ncbi:hypothetical protein BJY01DRAFT_183118 [Aspergillus pseudoustus]|uniref:Mid2 domain-containing protein n=1 Tax=Aspergillus pseudoustus TaxID=1810923 RepID=A0ABR4JYX3_9EURO
MFSGSTSITNLAGSAIENDRENGKITYAFDCRANVSLTPCVPFEVPFTATVGYWTLIYTASYKRGGGDSASDTTRSSSSSGLTDTAIVACSTATGHGQVCTSSYTSDKGDAEPPQTLVAAGMYPYEEMVFVAVEITDGLWKLDSRYPSPTAENNGTGSTSSVTQTAGPSSGSEADAGSDTGSASMAWISGPVIGALVAVVLLVGVIIFWRRRRRRGSALKGDGENAVAELEGKDKSELPANEVAAAELSNVNRERQSVCEMPT